LFPDPQVETFKRRDFLSVFPRVIAGAALLPEVASAHPHRFNSPIKQDRLKSLTVVDLLIELASV